ncbi:MAG: hypothetical protein QY302_03930 [Anaerolineales bacterium]|nr:MAG: hypothetical protein QY302_03930 [Anaerolineales bacterium]
MYNQNGHSSGAKWLFFLAMVVLMGAVALGANLKEAKWLNGKIASATAYEMNVQTDIERQKADLDLQVLKAQTENQINQMNQQAEYAAAKRQQELNESTVAAMQKADFQAGLYDTFNFGLMVVMIAIGVALTVAGIAAAIGVYKILNAKAQAIQPSQPVTVVVHKRQPSPAAQKARQREREEREREKQAIDNRMSQLFPNSETIWSAKDASADNLKPEKYPLAV